MTGVLPPLSDKAWQAEFALYQATPEYRLEAGPAGMTLADFKAIFFWSEKIGTGVRLQSFLNYQPWLLA